MNPRPLVLCVDDEPLLLQALARLLPMLGADVLAASDGRDALELLAELDPVPDLIVTDLDMPVLGGEELFRAVRRHPDLAHIPVVVLSGRWTDEPFDLHIAKPFGRDELRLALRLAGNPRRRARAAGAGIDPHDARPTWEN
jgi:CheY-like chemotaxis protein